MAKCKVCREELKEKSNYCISCNNYQDWRRHFHFSNTLIALLIALISVDTTSYPVMKSIFKSKTSNAKVSITKIGPIIGEYGGIGVTYALSNSGAMPASITFGNLSIELNNNKTLTGNVVYTSVYGQGKATNSFNIQPQSFTSITVAYRTQDSDEYIPTGEDVDPNTKVIGGKIEYIVTQSDLSEKVHQYEVKPTVLSHVAP